MNQARFARAVRAKDERQWSDGNPLGVCECFEIAKAKRGEHGLFLV
jgi:hypothetical protein